MAYAGVSGRFGMGLQNPQVNRLAAPAARGPRVLPMQPGQQTAPLQPTGRAIPYATQPVASPAMSQYEYAPAQAATPAATGGGNSRPIYGANANPARGVNWSGGRIEDQKSTKPIALEEPGIPGYKGADYVRADYVGYNPTAWQEPDVAIPDAGVDTRKVVDSTRHFLDEEMAGGMAETARRFGALGGLRSSGYMGSLGNLERKRDLDLASAYYKYDYDAAQQDANRRSTARENTLNRAFQGWGALEGRRSGEAARRTGFNQSEAGRETGFNQNEASREGSYDWNRYGAELSAAQRKQIYDQLMAEFGR